MWDLLLQVELTYHCAMLSLCHMDPLCHRTSMNFCSSYPIRLLYKLIWMHLILFIRIKCKHVQRILVTNMRGMPPIVFSVLFPSHLIRKMKSHAYLQPLDLQVGFTLPWVLVMISTSMVWHMVRLPSPLFYMRKKKCTLYKRYIVVYKEGGHMDMLSSSYL